MQEVRSHKRRRTNMDEQDMFSGLVYCADCGKPMVLHRAHTMKPEQNNFTCRTYKKDGAEACTGHYIREVALTEIVLETIRRATAFARSHPEQFAEYIQQKQSSEVAKEIKLVERELSAMKKRAGELDVVFKRMYEDSALGRVTSEQFRMPFRRLRRREEAVGRSHPRKDGTAGEAAEQRGKRQELHRQGQAFHRYGRADPGIAPHLRRQDYRL